MQCRLCDAALTRSKIPDVAPLFYTRCAVDAAALWCLLEAVEQHPAVAAASVAIAARGA